MRSIQIPIYCGLIAVHLSFAAAHAQQASAQQADTAPSVQAAAGSEALVQSVTPEPEAGETPDAGDDIDGILTAADLIELLPQERSAGPYAAGDAELSAFLWQNRVLVIFADTDRDLNYIRQMDLIQDRLLPLQERGVIVLTDTDPAGRKPIRTKLRPRGFAAVLVDKDGRVVSRRPSPWNMREVERTIDSTPLRLQELREMRDAIDPIRGGAR